MSEDIHKWSDGRYTLMFDEHTFFVFDNEKEEQMTALKTTKRLNEQQATINLLLDLLYQSEATVIHEYSSHIGEDMDKLDKIFKEKDIKEIERFVRGCDDE